MQACALGSPAAVCSQQVLKTRSEGEGMGCGGGGSNAQVSNAQPALLPGSGEGKQCSWYQTPPASEEKHGQV